MGLLVVSRSLGRFVITECLDHQLSRSVLVRLLAAGTIRYLPHFIRHPLLLHVAEYSRRHPEFFHEMEAAFNTCTADAFQAAFWGSDFGYSFMALSDTQFHSKEFFGYFRQISEELPCHSYLDVGCGYGSLCRWIKTRYPSARVIGLDISQRVLSTAQKQARDANLTIEFIHASATDLLRHFAPRSVESVICADSFQYVEDGQEALRQMATVASRAIFVVTPRGPLSLDAYLGLEQSFRQHDYDRHWVHPLVAYARNLELPVYRHGPTSVNCYYLDIRL